MSALYDREGRQWVRARIRSNQRSACKFLLAAANLTPEQNAADPELGPQHLMMATQFAREAARLEGLVTP